LGWAAAALRWGLEPSTRSPGPPQQGSGGCTQCCWETEVKVGEKEQILRKTLFRDGLCKITDKKCQVIQKAY